MSLLGVKKAWATPRSVSFRGLIQNFQRASPPLSYVASSPHPRSPLRTTISTNLRLNQEQNENITFWILISLIEVRSEKFYIFGCHLSDAAVVRYYQQSHPWFHLISLCFKLIIIHYHPPPPPTPPKRGLYKQSGTQ